MFFAATGNMAVVGYRAYMVAFDSEKRRNMFVKNEPMYKAITAKEAKKYDQEKICRRFPESIFDLNNILVDIVY